MVSGDLKSVTSWAPFSLITSPTLSSSSISFSFSPSPYHCHACRAATLASCRYHYVVTGNHGSFTGLRAPSKLFGPAQHPCRLIKTVLFHSLNCPTHLS
eukprot:g59648.t1